MRCCSKSRSLRGAALVLLLITAACRTIPVTEAPWSERRAALQAVSQFQFSGRMAVTGGAEAFSAGLRWQQQDAAADVAVVGPLGLGAVQIHQRGDELQVDAGDGTRLGGAEAAAAMQRSWGFRPPLASLRYWLLGCADPASPAEEMLGDDQRLRGLQQDGWKIEYLDYQQVVGQVTGHWLPRRLTLQRDALQVRLVINQWRLQ